MCKKFERFRKDKDIGFQGSNSNGRGQTLSELNSRSSSKGAQLNICRKGQKKCTNTALWFFGLVYLPFKKWICWHANSGAVTSPHVDLPFGPLLVEAHKSFMGSAHSPVLLKFIPGRSMIHGRTYERMYVRSAASHSNSRVFKTIIQQCFPWMILNTLRGCFYSQLTRFFEGLKLNISIYICIYTVYIVSLTLTCSLLTCFWFSF